MSSTSISVRVNSEDKKNFEIFCEEVGLNTSAAINIFIKTVLREKKIPFEISCGDPFYSEENMLFLKESIKQIEEGKTVKTDLSKLKMISKE